MDSKKVQFIRVNGDTLKTEITDDEKKYRETHVLDGKSVLKKNIYCTACGKSLKEKVISKDVHTHPVLEVLWCKKCEEFYSDGEFSADEDGSDKYCRWCAQGGELYCCSYCSVAFCKKCVKRNLPRKTLKDIEDDEWKCFVCVTDPLWDLRATCEAAKRYAEAGSRSRKSTRIAKNLSEEDTTGSDVSSSKRFTRKKKNNAAGSAEDEKYNADSEDTASVETNKNKRKYVSSSEENSKERKSRKRKISDVAAKPQPHPDERKKEKFEAIVTDAINESAVLRKLLTKKEATWKKSYFGTDVTKLNETVQQSKEEFSKFFSDIKTSINLIEKSFTDKFEVLDNELNKTEEKTGLSPVKENSTSDVPEVESKDEDMADVSIVTEIPEKQTPEKSPRKSFNVSTNGTDDVGLTVFDDDSPTDASDKPVEADKTKASISDSLAVNVSSIIDSLNSDDENELRNQNNSVKEPDSIEVDQSKSDHETESNAEIVISDKEDDDDEVTVTEPTQEKEPTLDENDAAKLSLLQQSSSDNNTTDNDKPEKLSTDSELSGVDVLHSDQEDVNKTKLKKKKTRKELNSLVSKESKSPNEDVSDDDKEIERKTKSST